MPAIARSGCRTSIASSEISSAKSKLVNSLSPTAIGQAAVRGYLRALLADLSKIELDAALDGGADVLGLVGAAGADAVDPADEALLGVVGDGAHVGKVEVGVGVDHAGHEDGVAEVERDGAGGEEADGSSDHGESHALTRQLCRASTCIRNSRFSESHGIG